jgi:hypothetical protein
MRVVVSKLHWGIKEIIERIIKEFLGTINMARYNFMSHVVEFGLLATKILTAGTFTYIGKAQIGDSGADQPVWQIKRIEDTGTLVTILWADGNPEFDNVWDNCQSLNYF